MLLTFYSLIKIKIFRYIYIHSLWSSDYQGPCETSLSNIYEYFYQFFYLLFYLFINLTTLTLSAILLGWIKMPNTKKTYGNGNGNLAILVMNHHKTSLFMTKKQNFCSIFHIYIYFFFLSLFHFHFLSFWFFCNIFKF